MQLTFDTFGSRSDPALLLLSGLGAARDQWRESFCGELARAGIFVVRVDNRDAGDSPSAGHLGTVSIGSVLSDLDSDRTPEVPYRVVDMAGDVERLLDHLDLDSAHLCGASMGGTIALVLAVESPSRVATVSTVSCGAGPEAHKSTRRMALANTLAKPARGEQAWVERAVRVWRSIGTPGDPADEAFVRDLAKLEARRGAGQERYARQLAALLALQRSTHSLADVIAPVLIIRGDQDVIVSRAAAEHLVETLPESRLVELSGMGHDLPRRYLPQIAGLVSGHMGLRSAASPEETTL